jgi:hypothetical protein
MVRTCFFCHKPLPLEQRGTVFCSVRCQELEAQLQAATPDLPRSDRTASDRTVSDRAESELAKSNRIVPSASARPRPQGPSGRPAPAEPHPRGPR